MEKKLNMEKTKNTCIMHLKLREDSTVVHNLKGHDAEMKTCALTFHSYPDTRTKTTSTWILQRLARNSEFVLKNCEL